MKTLALDTSTHDLALDANGRASLLDGAEAIRQRVRCRLALWRGEYVLNLDEGVPYTNLLGRKDPNGARVEKYIRAAITTCPGVVSLESFSLALDSNRNAVVAFSARATTGDVIEEGGFVAGEVP